MKVVIRGILKLILSYTMLLSGTFLVCCEQKMVSEQKKNILVKEPVKMYAGNPDLPGHINEITSIGIGKVVLADTLNSLDIKYDSVTNIVLYTRERGWPAKKIILEKGQWILAMSTNSADQITTIYTNAQNFKAKGGYYIGMRLDSAFAIQDSIYIDEREKAFLLTAHNIWFKIDPASEKKIFTKQGKQNLKLYKHAVIHEFFIRCGDC